MAGDATIKDWKETKSTLMVVNILCFCNEVKLFCLSVIQQNYHVTSKSGFD